MKLSPHQVRSVLEVNEQTLRYWKHIYPPLSGRRGYGPCYTFSEVLVLLITKRLVEQLGVNVSKLVTISADLFDACKASSVLLLSSAEQSIHIDVTRMTIIPSASEQKAASICIELSLSDLAKELRSLILDSLGDDETAQLSLALGPGVIEPSPKQKQA